MAAVLKLKNILLGCAAAALAAILVAAVYLSGSYAVFAGNGGRLIPIYSVGRDDKHISITFDCAWGADYTPAILEALEKYNVNATFFMVQFWAEKYADVVADINAAGNEIGTHSKTHSHMPSLSAEDITAELKSSAQAITNITGKQVDLFRAPFGDYNNKVISAAQSCGMYTIQWDVDSLDWKDLSAAQIVQRVTSRVQSGSIILMHNNGLHTAEAVPVILQTLIDRGYTFVPVGQLIYRRNFTIDPNGRQQPQG